MTEQDHQVENQGNEGHKKKKGKEARRIPAGAEKMRRKRDWERKKGRK